jgi:hypothetical protein
MFEEAKEIQRTHQTFKVGIIDRLYKREMILTNFILDYGKGKEKIEEMWDRY